LKYKRFNIVNYKGIKDLTFDLYNKVDTKIYTLVGLNESGKTTLLESLAYWYETAQEDENALHELNIVDKRFLIPRSDQFDFNDSISLAAEIEIESSDWIKLNSILIDYGYVVIKSRSKAIISYSVSHDFISSELSRENPRRELGTYIIVKKLKGYKEYQISPDLGKSLWHAFSSWIKRSMPKIIYYPNFLFDFPEKIYIDRRDDDSKIQNFYYRFLQDLLDSIGDGLTIEKTMLLRAKKSTVPDKRTLESLVARISTVMNDLMAHLNVFQFELENKKIVLTIPQSDFQSMRYFVQFNLKENDDTYEIKERSLGFRWFFTFILLTQFRINRAEDTSTIFLLDEPASNLHQTAQKKLLHAIENLTGRSGSGVIYTTHSHHLINPMWLEGTYIVKNEAYDVTNDFNYTSKNTNIKIHKYREFVEKNPSDIDYFQPILDVLEYQPSSMEKLSNALILEGKNDFYTLKYVLGNKESSFSIIPGTSATKLSILISLYYGWGKKFVVLLDSDEAGQTQKTRYIESFGALATESIFTLEDIESEWKNMPMEKLFDSGEKIAVQKIKYPDDDRFNKKHFNFSIQEAVIQNMTLPLSETTLEKFSKIILFVSDKIK
jgi:predicted ATPase/5S rRNA maturation endonuclease (ribonuclease M5)